MQQKMEAGVCRVFLAQEGVDKQDSVREKKQGNRMREVSTRAAEQRSMGQQRRSPSGQRVQHGHATWELERAFPKRLQPGAPPGRAGGTLT